MKLINTIFLSVIAILFTFQSQAQRGKHLNYTVSTSGDVVNTYTSASAGSGTVLTVANNTMTGAHFTGNLEPGDLIMIIQMYGADVDINTGPVVSWGSPYTLPDSYWSGGNWGEFPQQFGRILNYNQAGKFEQVEVQSVSGSNTINLQCALKNTYNFSKKVQVIRIPRYDNLTVNNGASIVPTAWNGTTGGVVALEVETALNVISGGSIHANGLGFRGGQLDPNNSLSGSTASPNEWRYLGTPNDVEGSEKGESIFGYHTELDAVYSRWGIGAVANGGGGGGYQNTGGGGGSNVSAIVNGYTGNGVPNPAYNTSWALDFSGPPYDYTSVPGVPIGTTNLSGTSTPGGGRGGYALAQTDRDELTVGPRNASWGGDARKTNGGRGGHPLVYDATRLFFGGGGGAGDQDGGQGGAGGNGGGIVYIKCYGNITGSGAIEANGAAGQGTNPLNQNTGTAVANRRKGNDGAGGGGAGGAILIENATLLPATIKLNSKGGNGGNQNMRLHYSLPVYTTTDEAAGPGGSGTGGYIAFNSGVPTQDVTAGANGVVISERGTPGNYTPTPAGSSMVANFPPNGATNGSVGMSGLSAPYYDLTIRDTIICSGSVNLTVTVLGTLPAGGIIRWYDQPFGGTILQSGTTYSASPATTTTYYIGVCPNSGTFRVPVTVTVVSSDDASFTSSDFCASSVNTISGVATPSGTFSIASQSGSGSVTINGTTGILANYVAGDQITIRYTTPAGPCQNSSTQVVNVTGLDDASFTSSDFCASSVNSISGVATPGGTFSISSQTGSATINSSSGVLTGFAAGDQITIQYNTPAGGCQNSSTQVVNVNAADNASFTSSDFCATTVNSISGVATPGGTFSISSQTGSATINSSSGVLSGFAAGDQITIRYTTPAGGCQNSSTQVVNVNATDDASFTSSDFCASSVNSISGVTTPGGTFSIASQSGSGSVTINGTTGILANYVAGDQITIRYTTPAGPCQNSSTQVVNVTGLDDASFTSSDFCASSVNSISGVATPGGTFSISSQTGSATINSSSGVLAGFAAGDQITIQYTTPAGGCQNSSTQTVNVYNLPLINVSNDGPVCIGGDFNLIEQGGAAVSWNWSTTGGATITTNTDQSPNVTGAVDGDVFTVVVTDANSCTNTGNTTISIIQAPVLDPIANVTNCGPFTLPTIQGVNLTGSESYYDNSVFSGGTPITGSITSSQTVWVYDGIATCEDEISFQVTIDPLPTITSFTGGNNYCDGDIPLDVVVAVTGTADWTIDYTLDGIAQSVTSTTSTISLGNTEGVYILTNLTDANCTDIVNGTQTIIVTTTPTAPVASGDAVYCVGDPMSDMSVSGNGGTYTWYTDALLTSTYGTGSTIFPAVQTMTYYVTESLNGCESTADNVIITVDNCDITYPTAFTPDGDGSNDNWEILGLDDKYPDNIVRIYNRWGNLIFEHKSSITNPYNNNRWDGTYKGSPLPVGSFYYIIDLNGKSEQATGTVSIILN